MCDYARVSFALLLLSAVGLSGCLVPDGNPEYHEIEYTGHVDERDGTFALNGTLYVELGPEPGPVYQDVQIQLYDTQREQVDSIPVGTLSAGETGTGPTQHSLTITRDSSPAYVVVESPDFWTDDSAGLRVVSFERTDDGYRRYYRLNETKFPTEEYA